MTFQAYVHLLPALFSPEDVRGGVVVILDILRASTTIVHALANGAVRVIPTLEVEEARTVAGEMAVGAVLLGGERKGMLIPGFDLDNNPLAYTAELVKGRTVVFTTTNGTKALHHCKLADRVLIGSFVNLQAIVDVLATEDRPIHLVCAGTNGRISLEDVLCAGAIVDGLMERLEERGGMWYDDQLQLALDHFLRRSNSPGGIAAALRQGEGGRNCVRLGYDEQILRAATLSLFEIVPEYHPETGEIR